MLSRREFAISAVAATAAGPLASSLLPKPEPTGDCDTGDYDAVDFREGILFPTSVHYSVFEDEKAEDINLLICDPKTAAVLAHYTKHERPDAGAHSRYENGGMDARDSAGIGTVVETHSQFRNA